MEAKRGKKTNIYFKKIKIHLFIILSTIVLFNNTGKNQAFGQNKIFTLLSSPTMGPSLGCGWIDYNNDNKLDAYNVLTQSSCLLHSTDGNRTFQLITGGILSPTGSYFSGLCWGDYDNNGYPDLYITNMGGGNAFYKNLGDGNFQKVINSAISKIGGSFLSSNWIDFNNDGNLDLWISASGSSFTSGLGISNLLFKNNGDDSFTKVNDNAIARERSNSDCAAFADYDNDGDMDAFMTEWGKDNWLFKNNGDGSFTKITGTTVNSNSNISITASWGDYDNDGYMDLFVGNGGTSNSVKVPNYLFHNNGDGTFTKITNGDIANYRGCVWTSAWGDVDNDGDLDLYAGTFFQKEELLYINNGDGTFTQQHEFDSVKTADGTGITGASLGDYDNDGFLDLLVANNNLGNHSFIYHNNGNSNHWINIKCEGTVSNRSAIGTRVKLKATILGKSYWQIREITGIQGFRGSNDLRVHFGLGDASVIDSLVINWPSGAKTIQTGIPINQCISIAEEIPSNYVRPIFTADVFKGKGNLTVHFTGNCIVNENHPITSWSWDFDNDGKEDSKEQNPVYTYHNDAGGTYSVSLTVSNGIAAKTIVKNDLIKIFPKVTDNLAVLTKVTASSIGSYDTAPENVVDVDMSTRWASGRSDSQWIMVELDSIYKVGKVVLKWESSYGRQYEIQTAVDTSSWQTVYTESKGNGGTDTIKFSSIEAKYIRMFGIKRAIANGYSLYEFEVYKSITTEINEIENQPFSFKLNQNYPNPFNPSTTITYSIPNMAKVKLEIYDILGRKVQTLLDETKNIGSYSAVWNGLDDHGFIVGSGVYFSRLTMESNKGTQTITKKMILLK